MKTSQPILRALFSQVARDKLRLRLLVAQSGNNTLNL